MKLYQVIATMFRNNRPPSSEPNRQLTLPVALNGIVGSFVAFVTEHPQLLVTTSIALLASYGFAATNSSLSIDEEIHLVIPQLRAWISQERFGIAALKVLRDNVVPLPFFNVFVSCLLLAFSCLSWCYLFVQSSDGKLARRPELHLFAIFFLCLPTNSYFMTFNTLNIEVSFGIALAPWIILLITFYLDRDVSWPVLILAFFLVSLCISIYQSLTPVLLAGALAIYLTQELAGSRRKSDFRVIVMIASLIFCAIALNFAVSKALRTGDVQYIGSYFNWGHLEAIFIIRWIWRSVVATLAGSAFVGGQFVPLAVLATGFALYKLVRLGRFSAPVLLAILGLMACPFLLSVALGTAMPLRSQQALPLAFGFLLLLPVLALTQPSPPRGAAKLVVFGLGILMLLWGGEANTRLFLSKRLSYERDVRVAQDIVQRLQNYGWRGDPIVLLTDGKLRWQTEQFIVESETFGASFLSWDDGARAALFMRHLGYRFSSPSSGDRLNARLLLDQMPAWPAADSVRLVGNVALVKLAK